MTLPVDDRHGEQVVLRDQASDILAVGQGPHGDWPAQKSYRKHGILRGAGHESAKRDCLEEHLGVRIDDVNRIDSLSGALDLADMLQRLADGPGRRHAHELGGHDAARRLLWISEQLSERSPRLAIEPGKQAIPRV